MTTRADIIAARESVGRISKEALWGEPSAEEMIRDASQDNLKQFQNPDYWYQIAQKEFAGLQGTELEKAKQDFVKKHAAKLIDDQANIYQQSAQAAAEGGMFNRYNMSAGGIGAAVGALLGGVMGGGKGALIGGLLGGIALYAVQKLGIGGDSLQNFFKSSVDQVLGPAADPVDRESMMKQVQAGVDKVQGTTPAPEADANVPFPARTKDTSPTAPFLTPPKPAGPELPPAGQTAPAPEQAPAAAQAAPAPEAPAPVNPEAAEFDKAQQLLNTAPEPTFKDDVQARRDAARKAMYTAKSVPGKIRGAIAEPMTHVKEYAKIPGQLASAAKKNYMSAGKGMAGLTSETAGAIGSQAKAVGQQTKNWLGKRIKDTGTILGGLKGN